MVLTFRHLGCFDSAALQVVTHELDLVLQHLLVVPPRLHSLLPEDDNNVICYHNRTTCIEYKYQFPFLNIRERALLL